MPLHLKWSGFCALNFAQNLQSFLNVLQFLTWRRICSSGRGWSHRTCRGRGGRGGERGPRWGRWGGWDWGWCWVAWRWPTLWQWGIVESYYTVWTVWPPGHLTHLTLSTFLIQTIFNDLKNSIWTALEDILSLVKHFNRCGGRVHLPVIKSNQ